MPKIESEIPQKLRPYLFHGVDLSWDSNSATGTCPWCGREDKFSVSIETGLWRCYVCGEGTDRGGGNVYTFLRKLWEVADKNTVDYSSLAAEYGLLPDTLVHWELVLSPLTDEWLMPGYNAGGKLCQLYRRVTDGQRIRLLPTPSLGHQLYGVSLMRAGAPAIYVCEGLWDAMALWEAMGRCKQSDDGLVPTANVDRSLLYGANVIAVPGCSTFLDTWFPLFKGKMVRLMYDNDHPRMNPKTGRLISPAGWTGMRRVTGLLSGVARGIKVLRWGGGEEYDSSRPSGYDVRDALTNGTDSASVNLSWLLSLVGPVPDTWVKVKGKPTSHSNKSSIDCIPCKNYRTLITAWRKALLWTDGLDRALACMLATIASTQMVGDQLWIKVLGPAACGKSTLCEAVSVNHDYVLAKSTMRGFHSGFTEKGEDKNKDNSLLSLLPGKTLVTKDGDTLLSSPNLPQILSEGRDVYDGVSRTHYRNAMGKDYDGLRITWILCGTSSLRSIDSSELGERFLDCVIMESIDDELEDEILDRVVHRAVRDVATESDGESSGYYAEEMMSAMQLTGGYVSWLRKHAVEKLATTHYSLEVKRRITRLGKFIAHMRARPSLKQEEVAEREFATRLVSQLTRLAGCLSLVLNRSSVDTEVMCRVQQIAMDTSRGRTLSITTYIYETPGGLESKTLAMLTAQTEDKTRALLRFLKSIRVLKTCHPMNEKGVKSRVHWKLTDRMHRLFSEITNQT